MYLRWAFARSYERGARREQFPCHRDSSVVTANVLLSEPGADFAGAELYVLGPEHANADTLGAREFKRRLPDSALRQPPHAVRAARGECVMHLGKRLHGVLPIEAGRRYTLILMFYERRDGPERPPSGRREDGAERAPPTSSGAAKARDAAGAGAGAGAPVPALPLPPPPRARGGKPGSGATPPPPA